MMGMEPGVESPPRRTPTQADHHDLLLDVSIALSAERNRDSLLEKIVLAAKSLCLAEAGTLYLRTEDDHVAFEIMRNDALGIALGGTTGKRPEFPPLPLHRQDGTPNHENVVTHAALTGETVVIADAYRADEGFDFSGTRAFDAGTGYRSKSFLTVPMRDAENHVIGVLQLINAKDRSGRTIAFSRASARLARALASLAGIAIENQGLLQAQKNLLDSFIRVIAGAIDDKSPYTGYHCQRVPVLTEMIARAACESSDPPFRAFELDDNGWYELQVAAWLHDCGKITVPDHVMDKATKLETIHDRIHTVKARFAALRAEAEADYWRGLAQGGDEKALAARREERLARLEDDLRFLEEINLGGEFMAPEKLERLHAIASRTWRDGEGREQPLLDEDEVRNLGIARGTLTDEEREIINGHMNSTIKMLEQLPFPKHMRNVVEYAGGHHEKMDGTGYPKGLKREEMSIPARIMAIADIFEALTAADRPYKKAKTLSETIAIMAGMRDRNHIDPDIFDLFLRAGVYRDYARQFLKPEQIDTVDIDRYLGSAHSA